MPTYPSWLPLYHGLYPGVWADFVHGEYWSENATQTLTDMITTDKIAGNTASTLDPSYEITADGLGLRAGGVCPAVMWLDTVNNSINDMLTTYGGLVVVASWAEPQNYSTLTALTMYDDRPLTGSDPYNFWQCDLGGLGAGDTNSAASEVFEWNVGGTQAETSLYPKATPWQAAYSFSLDPKEMAASALGNTAVTGTYGDGPLTCGLATLGRFYDVQAGNGAGPANAGFEIGYLQWVGIYGYPVAVYLANMSNPSQFPPVAPPTPAPTPLPRGRKRTVAVVTDAQNRLIR